MADFSQVDDATLARRYRNADAAAQQGDEKARVAARAMAAEINARRGARNQQPQETGYEGVVPQTMGGFNEGVANVIGAPVQLAQGATNLGIRGVNALFGTDYPYVENAPGSTDWMIEQGGQDIPMSSVVGAPAQLAQGQINYGVRNLNALLDPFGVEIPYVENLPGSTDWMNDRGVMQGTGTVIPPDTGTHPGMRKVGEYGGAGMASLATLGLAGTTQAAQQGTGVLSHIARGTTEGMTKAPATMIASDLAASASAVPGGRAGGNLAETIAGAMGAENPEDYRQVGEALGEVGAGVLGGGTVAIASNPGGAVRFALQDPESTARLAAARRLGIEATPGLVGNPTTAYMENTAGLNPAAGNVVRTPQYRQVEGVANAYSGITNDMRAGTGLGPVTHEMDAGNRIKSFAYDASKRVDDELGALAEQEMAALGGKYEAIPVNKIKTRARELAMDLDYEGRVALQKRMAALEADRVTPIDRKLHDQLNVKLNRQIKDQEGRRKLLATIEAKAANGQATPQELRQARNLRHRMDGYAQNIKKTEKQIDANKGVMNIQLDNWRKRLGAATDEGGPVDPGVSKALYAAERNQQRDVASNRGTLDDFTRATAENRRLVSPGVSLLEGGDKPFLESLHKAANGNDLLGKQVYDFLHAQGAGERIIALKRNLPKKEFDTVMGDFLSVMARPESQHAVNAPMATENFNPAVFMTRWHRLPPSTRKAITDSLDLEDRIQDIRTLGRALTMRSKHANPSGTAATAIMAKIFGGTVTNKALSFISMGTNLAWTKAVMSPKVVEIIAKEAPAAIPALNAMYERTFLKGMATENEDEPEPSGRLKLELNDPENQQRNSR